MGSLSFLLCYECFARGNVTSPLELFAWEPFPMVFPTACLQCCLQPLGLVVASSFLQHVLHAAVGALNPSAGALLTAPLLGFDELRQPWMDLPW